MQKVKILAVAPYEGMADLISSIAQKRDDITLTVQTGDLQTGKEIALQLAHKNYDVIISRGGTAELIKSALEVPVIDIQTSVYDILSSIKLAENYAGKCIIAGFPGITEYAHLLCDLLQYDIDILTITEKEEAIPLLTKAKENGCSLVLCDMTGANAAKELGLNSLLISSGAESIEHAIDEAVKLVHSSSHVHKQKDLFQALLTEEDKEFLIYSPSGSLWFSSIAIDEMNISLMNLVQTYLKAFIKVPNQTIAKQIRDDIYVLTNKHIIYEGMKYVAISISKKKAITKETDLSIIISNHLSRPDNDFMYYYSNSGSTNYLNKIVTEYSRSRLPVLITGEPGTGKNKAAAMLCENSPFKDSPLITINFSLISERKLNTLINNDSSPLNSIHNNIHLKNIDSLNDDQIDSLFQYIEQSKLCKRNRVVFSLVTVSPKKSTFEIVKSFCENHLSCLTLNLPPLRDRIDELPSILAIHLHRFNTSFGTQIIGFDTEGMEEMAAYHWPRNLDQLQHVLQELITVTNTPYISSVDVKHMLSQEEPIPLNTDASMKLSGTLDEINYKIIQIILNEENGNKEKTSARLGISRSTLWRILKNHDNL